MSHHETQSLASQSNLHDRLLALRERSQRDESGTFVIEGVRFVLRAVQAGVRFEAVFSSRRLLQSRTGRGLVRRLREAGVPSVRLSPSAFRRLSLAERPQGIGAIVRQRWTSLRRVEPATGDRWVALHAIRSPGNLGTILRTADATAARGLIALGDGVDPHDPRTVRATMGSLFAQRLVRTSFRKLRSWADGHDVRIVGTSPAASRVYHEADLGGPLVLLAGSERRGLCPPAFDVCDEVVRLPMRDGIDSLNVSVATSVVLYEAFRQRGRADRIGSV